MPPISTGALTAGSMGAMSGIGGTTAAAGGSGFLSALGGFAKSPGGGLLGSSLLGSIGQGFSGDEEDKLTSEEKALLKSQTRGQEIENYQQQAGSGPASILQERMKMDQLLAQYGPAATPLRIANMAMAATMLGTGEMYNLGEAKRTLEYMGSESGPFPNAGKAVQGALNKVGSMGQGGGNDYRKRAIEQLKKKFGGVMGASPNYGQLLGGGR